jgi:hypothetical protein
MLRAARVDEWTRQGESATWFDEWKKTRNPQPPRLPQLPASWINEAVKKAEPGFKPPDLPRDVAPPPKGATAPHVAPKVFDEVKPLADWPARNTEPVSIAFKLPNEIANQPLRGFVAINPVEVKRFDEIKPTVSVTLHSWGVVPNTMRPNETKPIVDDAFKALVDKTISQAPPPKVPNEVNWRLIGDVAKPTPEPTQWSFADLVKNAPPDVQKQLIDLSAELAKWLQPRTVVTPQGTYVVDTVPPDVVIRNILYNLQQSNISPENLYSELIAKLKGEIEQLKEQRAKEEEKNLDKAFERVEEQRRREAELGERLDRLKSMRGGQWRVPALIELPESPFAISPWRWAAPKPIELLMPGRRREVPA